MIYFCAQEFSAFLDLFLADEDLSLRTVQYLIAVAPKVPIVIATNRWKENRTLIAMQSTASTLANLPGCHGKLSPTACTHTMPVSHPITASSLPTLLRLVLSPHSICPARSADPQVPYLHGPKNTHGPRMQSSMRGNNNSYNPQHRCNRICAADNPGRFPRHNVRRKTFHHCDRSAGHTYCNCGMASPSLSPKHAARCSIPHMGNPRCDRSWHLQPC